MNRLASRLRRRESRSTIDSDSTFPDRHEHSSTAAMGGNSDNGAGIDLSLVTLMSTGSYHTDVIMAKVGHDLIGGMGMENEIDVSWFRKPAQTSTINKGVKTDKETPEFVRIDGVQSAYYTPSADDIGATICFRCQDKSNPSNKGFAQIGPLEMEPSVREGVAKAIDSKYGSFPVTLSSHPGKTYQLIFGEENVRVAENSESEDEGQDKDPNDIFSCTFTEGLSVIIEASSPSALELVAFNLEPGDISTGWVTSRLLISATSPRDRDIISIGIRALRDKHRSSLLLPSVASISLREKVGDFAFDGDSSPLNSTSTSTTDIESEIGTPASSTPSDESFRSKNETSIKPPPSSAAAAAVRTLRAKVTSLEAEIKRADEREAFLEKEVATSQRARNLMETELVEMQAERDTAKASAASAEGELIEARDLAKAAGVKQRIAEDKVKTLEEENAVLQSEIKRAKDGHSEARKARQIAESQLGLVEERALANEEKLKQANERFQKRDAEALQEAADAKLKIEQAQEEIKNANALQSKQESIIETSQKHVAQLEETVASLRRDIDRLEGERNSMKKKANGLKRDMARIFRACGGSSFEDVEALVRERRELQVAVKVQKAERDAAKDDLRAYKDALQRQLVDNAKDRKKSLRTRIREKAEKATGRRLSRSSNTASGAPGKDPEGFSLEELQNLTFKLMDQLEERDERMSLKELEKRQLFDRIIALETKLELSQGGDGGHESGD